MSDSSKARNLRRLLTVAKKLRALAGMPLTGDADRDLFLATACALEARANWVATSSPDEPYEPARALHLHQPVNLLV